MASLSDIFNPTFFIFLGIILLVAALLVVYFETKNREQNHKINSMFSLVSSLAEEVNNLKFSLGHFSAIQHTGGNMNFGGNTLDINEQSTFFPYQKNTDLISVSDGEVEEDEDSDEDESEESELDDREDLQSVSSSSSDENSSDNQVKVLKLSINNLDEEAVLEDIEDTDDDLEDLEDLDEQSVSSDNSSLSAEGAENLLALQSSDINDINEVEKTPEFLDISSSDLKTININLEEETVDYRKLPITKLRSIVAEKGLSNDTSKLKKNDLLKLLGIE